MFRLRKKKRIIINYGSLSKCLVNQTSSDIPCRFHLFQDSTVIDTPPLFHRMIMMAAASEGGILPLDCPDVGNAITDAYKGIRLADGVLQYNKVSGFDILDLD